MPQNTPRFNLPAFASQVIRDGWRTGSENYYSSPVLSNYDYGSNFTEERLPRAAVLSPILVEDYDPNYDPATGTGYATDQNDLPREHQDYNQLVSKFNDDLKDLNNLTGDARNDKLFELDALCKALVKMHNNNQFRKKLRLFEEADANAHHINRVAAILNNRHHLGSQASRNYNEPRFAKACYPYEAQNNRRVAIIQKNFNSITCIDTFDSSAHYYEPNLMEREITGSDGLPLQLSWHDIETKVIPKFKQEFGPTSIVILEDNVNYAKVRFERVESKAKFYSIMQEIDLEIKGKKNQSNTSHNTITTGGPGATPPPPPANAAGASNPAADGLTPTAPPADHVGHPAAAAGADPNTGHMPPPPAPAPAPAPAAPAPRM